MRTNWRPMKLHELGEINRGRSRHRPRDDKALFGGPYPFVQTGDVKNANLYLSHYTQTYNKDGLAQSKLWQPGTLCITIAANIAETAILKIAACFPDSIVGFIPFPKIADVKFVKYYLETIKLNMQMASKGTTQDNLSLDKLLSFDIFTPPLPTQHKIAAILSAYDDLIENNTRRIAILEEMAQSIYQEWFVYFRYPGHEKNKMVESDLGMIPEGWEVKNLDDLCDITMGQSPSSQFYNENEDGLPFHQGVTDFGKYFPTNRIHCTVENRVAQAGDILFSVRAPVGRINVTLQKIVIGRGLSAIHSKTGNQIFILYQLKERFQKEDIIGNGAIFKSVTKNDMNNIKLFSPSPNIVSLFEKCVQPLFKEIEVLTRKNRNLKDTKDLLLPKLISGDIDVEALDIDISEMAEIEEQQEIPITVPPEPINATQLALFSR